MTPENQTEEPQLSRTEMIQRQMVEALDNPDVPRLYSNGFIISVGTGDILLVLKLSETPVAILNLSYTVAKTLAQKLGNTIANLEDRTGNTIMTTELIAEKMAKDEEHVED